MSELSPSAPSLSTLERWGGGFPGEHEFSTLEGLCQEGDELAVFFNAAQRLLNHWKGNKFVGLWLYGPPGTGKTHAAIGLGRKLHDDGAEVHYRYAQGTDFLWAKNFDERRFTENITSPTSIFPASYASHLERNPKTVLIIDDYAPLARENTIKAITAAAQFGGFVIVTSNDRDPFRLLEPAQPTKTHEEIVLHDLASRIDPDAVASAEAQKMQEEAKITESLRSRLAAGFRFIEFTGPDRRQELSFWND